MENLVSQIKFINESSDSVTRVEFDVKQDSRGEFTRIFCTDEFNQSSLNFSPKQINVSKSILKGTVRGLHFQLKPYSESKFIRVLEGSIFDVSVNLIPGENFMRIETFILSEKDCVGILIPKGFAHGFQTLKNNTVVEYLVDEFYSSEFESGLLWNDEKLNINWPIEASAISDRDKTHTKLSEDRIESIKKIFS